MDVFTNIAFICLQKRNEPVSESIPYFTLKRRHSVLDALDFGVEVFLCEVGADSDIAGARENVEGLRAHIFAVVGNDVLVGFHLERVHERMECAALLHDRSPVLVDVLAGVDGESVTGEFLESARLFLRFKLRYLF